VDATVAALLRKPLGVTDAVQVGLLRSPLLQGIYEEIAQAQADVAQAGTLRNPSALVERRIKGRALELDLAQDLLDLLFMSMRKKIARQELEGTMLKVSHDVLDYVAKTKEAFFELQAAIQLAEMRRSVCRATEASSLAAQKLVAAGNLPEIASLNEQRLAQEAQLALIAADNDVVQRREQLTARLGLGGSSSEWQIEPHLPEVEEIRLTVNDLEHYAVAERIDLQSEQRAVDALGAAIDLNGYSAMVTEAAFAVHSEREPEGTTTRGPSLSVSLPLFTQGQPQRAKSYAQFRSQADHLLQHTLDVRAEVRAGAARLKTAEQRVAFYKNAILPLQKKILDQSQAQYNGMYMSVFELLQAKKAQIVAGEELIQALRDYWIARTQLEFSVGGRLQVSSNSAVP
jgi:cobalt-zinc-cadmium efflux system outer membrane protein